jgi:WD40 repeat protein
MRINKPVRLVKLKGDSDVGLCKFTNSRDNGVLIATGSSLSLFDLRNTNQIVLSSPSLTSIADGEINDFDVASSHGFIAVPTDTGTLTILDESLKQIATSPATKSHDNICSVVRWLPDGKGLVSGGQDYSIASWSFDGSLVSRKRSRVEEFLSPNEIESPGTTFNPPFVSGIDLLVDGLSSSLAVSLGNRFRSVRPWSCSSNLAIDFPVFASQTMISAASPI